MVWTAKSTSARGGLVKTVSGWSSSGGSGTFTMFQPNAIAGRSSPSVASCRTTFVTRRPGTSTSLRSSSQAAGVGGSPVRYMPALEP